MRHLLVVLGLTALAACASLSEDECRRGDWSEIGYKDGSDGRDAGFLSAHREACAEYGITPDPVAWQAGREHGLTLYCRPTRAWREGSQGRRLKDVCAIGDVPTLRAQNQRGLTYYRIGQDIEHALRRIGHINSLLARDDLSSAERSSLVSERSFLRLDVLTLRTERNLYRL